MNKPTHLPLVSIIVPCYNSSRTILETINCIKAQSFGDYECIIVDDKSTDSSVDLIRSMINCDNRFRLIASPFNQGVSASRNIALDCCIGQYVAFLDSDDLWHSEFLERAISCLMDGEDFVYASVLRFLDTPSRHSFLKSAPSFVSFSSLKLNNHIPLLTAVFRSSLLNSSSRFEQQRPEDYIFWIKLFKSNPGLIGRRIVSKPLTYYRVSLGQRSSNKLVNIRRSYEVYRSVFGMSKLLSSFYTVAYVLNSMIDYFLQYASPRRFPFPDSINTTLP